MKVVVIGPAQGCRPRTLYPASKSEDMNSCQGWMSVRPKDW